MNTSTNIANIKKKCSHLVIALAAILAPAAALTQTQVTDARLLGKGGGGIAVNAFGHGALINPANASYYRDKDEVRIAFNGALLSSDDNKFIDALEDAQDAQEAGFSVNRDVVELEDQYQALDGATPGLLGGFNFTFSIPGDYLPSMGFVRLALPLDLSFDYTDADRALLERAGPDDVDPSTLTSTISALGSRITEVGIAIALPLKGRLDAFTLGLTPKFQQIETIDYRATIADFDRGDFLESNFTQDESTFNLDAGLVFRIGPFSAGIVATNLLEDQYTTVDGKIYDLKTEYRTGFGYTNSDGFTLYYDKDGSERAGLRELPEVQIERYGMEKNLGEWIQFRLGYWRDTNNKDDANYSLGVGVSPFKGIVSVDAVIVYNDDRDSMGGAIQVGFGI